MYDVWDAVMDVMREIKSVLNDCLVGGGGEYMLVWVQVK